MPSRTTLRRTGGQRQRLRSARSYACYYGRGALEALSRLDAAILAADTYGPDELEWLAESGTVTLGYVSLGEDASPEVNSWVRRNPDGDPMCDPDWGSFVVDPSHPAWTTRVLETASRLLRDGFSGLFLDTLDSERAEDRTALVALIGALRAANPEAPLVINRGFALLPDLTHTVDGVMFESLSCTWRLEGDSTVRYVRVEGSALNDNFELAERVASITRPVGLARLALDYADTPELEALARSVALELGFVSCVSNRMLTRLHTVDEGMKLFDTVHQPSVSSRSRRESTGQSSKKRAKAGP